MMRQLFWFVFFLASAAAIAFGSRFYPGTAQFTVASHQITMSIYVFAIALLLLTVLFSIVWRVYRATVGLPSRWRDSREKKKEYRALDAIQTATIALHEGRWAHADKAAKIASRLPKSAGLAALIATASAHAQGKPNEVHAWLAQLDGNKDFTDAKHLQQAEMALKNNDASVALTALDGVSSVVRKHSLRYRDLQINAHALAAHWHEVLQLAKDKKWDAPLEVRNKWFAQAVVGLADDDGASLAYLRSLYKDMPDAVRDDDVALQAYAKALIKRGEQAEARRVLEEAQRNRWRPALLPLYIDAADEDSGTAQLKMLDAWEVQRQAAGVKDADLLCAAGQMCFKAQIWGRAKANFQSSLAIKPSVQAHYGLAQTYRAMNDVPHAQDEEAKAAALASVK